MNKTDKKANETTSKPEDEKVTVRHTISAEETFTLAKDVFDLRCFIKNVYNNRAVIARRLNILTISASAVFTVLYVAYMIAAGLFSKLALGTEIVMYTLIGVYAALCITLVTVALFEGRTSTGGVKKLSSALKIFRILIRLSAIAISIAAISLSVTGGEYAAPKVAIDIVIIVLSIIMLIVQLIPLLFGGVAKLARWLLSPVKIKYRFSYVVMEWYELALSGKSQNATVKKVSKRYIEAISSAIDGILVPALGKKYITSIKPLTLLNVVNNTPEADRPIVEGILKSVFEYAAGCGYVTFDPCKDLNFEGTVEEERKKKDGVKGKLLNVGKKIGMSVLDKYISKNTDGDNK